MSDARIPRNLEQDTETEHFLTLGEFLSMVWRRLWVVLLAIVLCVSSAVGLSLAQTPKYEASITILVGQKEGGPTSLAAEVPGLQQLTQTLTELVSSRPVAEAAIRQLDLRMSSEDMLANLNAQQVSSTQSIEVSYRDPDPERAANIANAVGDAFSDQISGVSPTTGITATVWERAVIPEDPVSPDPIRNALLALVGGLIVGLGLAFLLEYFDDSWSSPEELEWISGVPTFGVIREFVVKKEDKKKPKKAKIKEEGA